MSAIRKRSVLLLVGAVMLTSGCAMMWPDQSESRRDASSSLVDFLYPKGVTPPEHTAKARLELPLRVGIGFIPGSHYDMLSERSRIELLEQVKAEFSELDYVQDIVIVPQTYLRNRNGLLAVEQVGRLYQLDIVGLVSYDQTIVSETRKSSLLYWTIVGAYVVKGNSNEVSTFVDLAVIDVRSTKLLLRAGGSHHDQNNSTLVERSADNRKNTLRGFRGATADLIKNFSQELEHFEESLKSNDEIEVVRSSGGSGSLVLELALLLGALKMKGRCSRRNLSALRCVNET